MDPDIIVALEPLVGDNHLILDFLKKGSFTPNDVLSFRELYSNTEQDDDPDIHEIFENVENDLIYLIDSKLFALEIDNLLQNKLFKYKSGKKKRPYLTSIKSFLEDENIDEYDTKNSVELLYLMDRFADRKDRLMCAFILEKIQSLLGDEA